VIITDIIDHYKTVIFSVNKGLSRLSFAQKYNMTSEDV